MAVKGVIYNQEKHIWDLKISSGIGEAVNRGVVLEYWGDCTDYSLLGRQSTEGWYWSIGGTVLTILYWGGSQQRGGIGVLGGLY